ncbi:amidohydrolase family protein [Phytoactinopolyspora limicola]|uniref:amidohydrolase family protein n=1 Tax=Phytoactinopolyspora limicola TaxID=2715536 RepID=UPI001407E54D|nr:amidohydrolase family protein [Phytoactinopolyspora limicola]
MATRGPHGEAVAEAGLPVALHAGKENIALVGMLAAAYPGIVYLLDHLGRPDLREGIGGSGFAAVLALAKHENVWLKTPNAPFFSQQGSPYDDLAPFLVAALDAFGAKRVVWGSDWPLCTEAASYQDAREPTLSVLRQYGENDKRLVLRGNFERLYHRV